MFCFTGWVPNHEKIMLLLTWSLILGNGCSRQKTSKNLLIIQLQHLFFCCPSWKKLEVNNIKKTQLYPCFMCCLWAQHISCALHLQHVIRQMPCMALVGPIIAVNVTCVNVKQVTAERIICLPWVSNYVTTNSVSQLSAIKTSKRLLQKKQKKHGEICWTKKGVKIHFALIRLHIEPDDIQT